MALTITIPGAVETTTGSTAPAVLTVGVGSPGVGVPSGGTTGQVLQKLSATNYDTGWATPSADFITSVTAPLAVTSGDLTVDLSDYLPLSGGTLDANSTIMASTATVNSLFAGDAFGLELSANPSENASLQYNGVQVQNAIGTMSVTSSGLTFPDLSTQTVAYPGSTGFLLKANNLSGLADTSVSRTNLGLGTMATATAADYSTTTVANGLYYPLSGNPSAFLVAADITGKANLASPTFTGVPLSTTAAVDTNTTQIATTAYVVGQAGTGTPIVDGSAAVGTSLRYARADHVHPTDTSRAALASPTFTGTPTLPTGTIATTQSPGNNTTAVATTAFVTAAVPAIATDAQARLGQSKTVASSPYAVSLALSNPSTYQWTTFNSVTSGAGAANNNYGLYVYEQDSPNASTAGYTTVYSNSQMSWVNGGSVSRLTFTKPVWISGKVLKVGGFAGDANNSFRSYVGNTDTGGAPNGGDPVAASIGIKFTGGASQVFQLMVHNGTSQTLVSGTTAIATEVVYEWMVYSDGSGNATLFINGVQEATTSAAPTATSTICYAVQAINQTVTAATRMVLVNRNLKVVVGN